MLQAKNEGLRADIKEAELGKEIEKGQKLIEELTEVKTNAPLRQRLLVISGHAILPFIARS